MIRANLRLPKLASASFRAPVQINLPDRNTSAVHRGSRIRITMPWNRDGLYSEFRVRKLMLRKFKSHPRFTEDTQFLRGKKYKWRELSIFKFGQSQVYSLSFNGIDCFLWARWHWTLWHHIRLRGHTLCGCLFMTRKFNVLLVWCL